MTTNLDSAFHLCQLAYPLLKASGMGSIVFISSVAGVVSLGTGSVYAASKGELLYSSGLFFHVELINKMLVQTKRGNDSLSTEFSAAINQLTKNLACEWAKDNIRSNCVAPWATRTPLVEHVIFLFPIFIYFNCVPFYRSLLKILLARHKTLANHPKHAGLGKCS